MGARSPENHDGGYHDAPSLDASNVAGLGGKPGGSRVLRQKDGNFGDDDGDDESDGDGNGDGEAGEVSPASPSTELTKKKRKKRAKRKSKAKAGSAPQQSSPPRVPLDQLFSSGVFPEGEVQTYSATARTTAAEARYNSRRHWDDAAFLNTYRRAAEVHRQTRRWVQEAARPGQTLHDIAAGIEDSVRALLDNAGLEPGTALRSGLAFPTGLCLNHQVAHYTPNPGQKPVVLLQQDVLTVDFGVHIDGWILDSAFTMAFDPVYDNLLAAVRDATNAGVAAAGVDVRISDVSAAIQEAMESYEVEIGGTTYPVRPVRDLCGHDIKRFRIHGGKSIPLVRNRDQTKMEEGEVFAVETFGSTGRGRIVDDVGVYGYGLKRNAPLNIPLALSSAARLHRTIRENFGTLVFCRRYLERLGVEKYLAGMNHLVQNGIVEEYGPLTDVKGSYSAQFEHTFLLRETHKEVFSRGDDY